MGNHSLPTVDQIFAAGVLPSAVNSSQIFNPNATYKNPSIIPGLYYPQQIQGLYYNMSFIFPEFPTIPSLGANSTCTVDTCSLMLGNFLYLPNVPANAFFAAFFAICMVVNIGFAIKGRTWGHLGGMVGGLALEILGYIGRIMIHNNDFTSTPFYLYIIGLTIGPAFLSASIYLCLARIVGVYGQHLSRFRPKTYTKIFIGCDFFSLVLQAAGGGMAASASDNASAQNGINIMIAGLAFQVVSLTVFMALCADFAFTLSKSKELLEPQFRTLRASGKFKAFLASLCVATITIYVRSIFRVAELKEGFGSKLANDEITFMVLEATMITIAVISLTALHPTVVFGSQWGEVSQVIRKTKKQSKSESVSSSVELTSNNIRYGGA